MVNNNFDYYRCMYRPDCSLCRFSNGSICLYGLEPYVGNFWPYDCRITACYIKSGRELPVECRHVQLTLDLHF